MTYVLLEEKTEENYCGELVSANEYLNIRVDYDDGFYMLAVNRETHKEGCVLFELFNPNDIYKRIYAGELSGDILNKINDILKENKEKITELYLEKKQSKILKLVRQECDKLELFE